MDSTSSDIDNDDENNKWTRTLASCNISKIYIKTIEVKELISICQKIFIDQIE